MQYVYDEQPRYSRMAPRRAMVVHLLHTVGGDQHDVSRFGILSTADASPLENKTRYSRACVK